MRDVPTLQEEGFSSYEASTWYGLFAPAGTPDAVTKVLVDAFRPILESKSFADQFAAQGIVAGKVTGDAFGKKIAEDYVRLGDVVKRAGTVVTCAATSGFMMEFDNRHFWMRLKRLVGSHFANYKEAYEANRLIAKGMIHPVMSQVFDLKDTGEAAYQVHHNMHEGKLGILCLAPQEGLGVDNHELRAQVGDKLNWFRR